MVIETLLTWMLCGWLAAALSSLLAPIQRQLAVIIGGCLACLAALCGSVAALQVLLAGAPAQGMLLPGLQLALRLDAFSAIWLLAICLPVMMIALFTISWQCQLSARVAGSTLPGYLLLVAAGIALLTPNAGVLVAAMEMASLCAVFMTANARASQLLFVSGRGGSLLLALACWLLWRTSGSLNFAQLHQSALAPMQSSIIWLLAAGGCALHAGLVPLQGWVPQAHAGAPAPAAALLSAVMLKLGLFGLMTFSLLFGQPPLWWGLVIMALGMLSAFIGGLYALMEHHLQRLLAYHSLENSGIILLGLGAWLCGLALNQPALATLGLIGGLFQLINHNLFKTSLLLGAGALWCRTGQHDIEHLGGLAKRMPGLALSMLVALMSMAALPPLNGFASEWLIYQSLFQVSQGPDWVMRLIGPLLAVGLAITGALAVMCMAKVFGVTFLGNARMPRAANALREPWLMTLSIALPALACLLLGISSPWLVRLMANSLPLPAASQLVAPPTIALLLVSLTLLPLLISALFARRRLPHRRRGDAWACGYLHDSSMVMSAGSFAQPVRLFFAPIIAARKGFNPLAHHAGWQQGSLAGLFRRLAVIELAVLLVVFIA